MDKNNKEYTMNKAFIIATMLLLVSFPFQSHAFRQWPQTGDEFRNVVRSGKGRVKMETHMINRDFKRVLAFFSKKANSCLNVRVVSRIRGRLNSATSTTIYTPKIKKTSSRTADFTLQTRTTMKRIGPKMPKGGFYAMVVDFTAVPGNKTKVNIYGPSFGYKKIFKAVKAWAEGKDQSCPKLY